MGIVPCFDPICCLAFGANFMLEKEIIWTSVIHEDCRLSCELEVRILNYPNWTSIAQVMVHLISKIVIA